MQEPHDWAVTLKETRRLLRIAPELMAISLNFTISVYTKLEAGTLEPDEFQQMAIGVLERFADLTVDEE